MSMKLFIFIIKYYIKTSSYICKFNRSPRGTSRMRTFSRLHPFEGEPSPSSNGGISRGVSEIGPIAISRSDTHARARVLPPMQPRTDGTALTTPPSLSLSLSNQRLTPRSVSLFTWIFCRHSSHCRARPASSHPSPENRGFTRHLRHLILA